MTPADPTTPAVAPTASNGVPAAPDLLAEPTFEESHAAWVRYYDDLKAGRVNFAGVPEGHHVAYYDGRILDHDADYIALRDRAATAAGVHWARLVIAYPWSW